MTHNSASKNICQEETQNQNDFWFNKKAVQLKWTVDYAATLIFKSKNSSYPYTMSLRYSLHRVISTDKYYRGDVSVRYYWFYNFPNQFIWCFVWICIACFLYHMFSLFVCFVKWIRKDVPTKLSKQFISSK